MSVQEWWQGEKARAQVEEALSLFNKCAHSERLDYLSCYRAWLDALHRLSLGLCRATKTRPAWTSKAIALLLVSGIPESRQEWLCEARSVATVAAWDPPIPKWETHRIQLGHKMTAWKRDRAEKHRAAVLGELAEVLYTVMSTAENEEQGAIHSVAKHALHDLIEALFDYPSHRLAVYGTLAPGQSNHSMLADIPGEWEDGTVQGVMGKLGPYPALRWDKPGRDIPVAVLRSPHLEARWTRLDGFEGSSYRRILIPVSTGEHGRIIANLYEAIRFG